MTEFHYFLWCEDRLGDFVGINHDKLVRQMRQERKPQYLETGAVYAMRVAGLYQAKHRFFGKTAHYVMPPEPRLEIDEPADLVTAERVLEATGKSTGLLDGFRAWGVMPRGVVFDFDGVFTDKCVLVAQNGVESVRRSRSDGAGLLRLLKTGIPVIVLSSEVNGVVSARCDKLGVECVQSLGDEKITTFRTWREERGFGMNEKAASRHATETHTKGRQRQLERAGSLKGYWKPLSQASLRLAPLRGILLRRSGLLHATPGWQGGSAATSQLRAYQNAAPRLRRPSLSREGQKLRTSMLISNCRHVAK